jgi:hypothetical protein
VSKSNEFVRGFGIACATMARDHGEETLAFYLMEGAGYRYTDFVQAGLEAYDLEPIRNAYRDHGALAEVDGVVFENCHVENNAGAGVMIEGKTGQMQ